MAQKFVLFGVDSVFTAEVVETVTRLGCAVAAGVLTGDPEWEIRGVPSLANEAEIDHRLLLLPAAIPWVYTRAALGSVPARPRSGLHAL